MPAVVRQPTIRRKSDCAVAGSQEPVGRCWFWWESCPAKVKNCELRAREAQRKAANG